MPTELPQTLSALQVYRHVQFALQLQDLDAGVRAGMLTAGMFPLLSFRRFT